MGKEFDSISPTQQEWIKKQKMFFVSTAPLSADGHINCSPKGLESFRVLDSNTVIYQDLVGSGAETIAHVKENKRIVIMFCAFEGPPKILRLHGHGVAITLYDQEFDTLNSLFPPRKGVRSYIRIKVYRVADSCGYSVPVYDFKKDRDVLDKWVDSKNEDELKNYIAKNNEISLDGLPAVQK